MDRECGATEDEKASEALVAIWRRLITDGTLSWVLFENGTVVVPADPAESLAQQALSIMKAWGRVSSDTPSGDFTVIALDGVPGWVVTSHFLADFDILTYVSPKELANDDATAYSVELLGRGKRERDATECVIVHIEDRRTLRNEA